MITAQQARDLAMELGFKETQAAGHFRYFDFPVRHYDATYSHWVAATITGMFYEPRGDLQLMVRGVRGYPFLNEEVFNDYVETEKELEDALRVAIARRHEAAIEELVRWDDARLSQVPKGLVQAARSPRREERHSAEAVIADLLLERGVPF